MAMTYHSKVLLLMTYHSKVLIKMHRPNHGKVLIQKTKCTVLKAKINSA